MPDYNEQCKEAAEGRRIADAMRDHGPAFPVFDLSKTQCPGMTLRDYFAGQALAGELASYNTEESVLASVEEMLSHGESDSPTHIANLCYRLADAMLKARTR